MKRWLMRILYLCGACVALLLITGLIAQYLVTGSSKASVVATLSRRLGVPLSVGETKFDLASWMLLKPAIALSDIAIGNPPGFRGQNLLTAKRISAQVALFALLSRRIEMRSIVIESPRIAVESDARNQTNIEALLKALSSPGAPVKDPQPAESSSAPALGINDFRLTDGEVLISGANSGEPPLRISAIGLRVQDLSAGTNCGLNLSGKLFGGRDSGFEVEGRAGPFMPQVLPIKGKLTLTIAPREIPASIRSEQFGVLLGSPGDKAKAVLEASIEGDLYNNVAGPAKLTLSGLNIGKDASHLMRMEGNAPALFSAQKLMSEPAFHLQVMNAKLKLGEGEWSGAADLRMKGKTMSGGSRGAIRSVDINTLLSSLTADGAGKIYGIAEIPTYMLQFSGKTADQMRNSLSGTAKLSVSKGRIAMLDMLGSIQRALDSMQSAGASSAGNTPFTTLTSDLSVGQARLDLSTIVFDSPALKFTGNGAIGFDHSMNFDLNAQVTGGLANMVNRLTRQASSGETTSLPLTVSGTLDHPQVRPNAKKLATGAVQGLFQSLFNKQQK